MTVIACGQHAVLGEGCPVCGGWLYASLGVSGEKVASGVPVTVPGGATVCSMPECVEYERTRVATFDERNGR